MTTAFLCLLFAVIFIGGPMIFRLMTRPAISIRVFRQIAMFTAFCAVAGMGLRYGFPGLWGQSLWFTGVAIGFIWLAWIGILAYGALALRRADPGRKMRRWTAVIGSVGTTIPWFGLASAQLISGG